ncbi:hypothetical protein GF342_03320 [Candidatus Woesearchaeota archaeon]|nr:hypothetical protein [Candidatus Woesearchaeota archaeon]
MVFIIYDRYIRGSVIHYVPFEQEHFRAAEQLLAKDPRFTYLQRVRAYQQGADIAQFIDNTLIQFSSTLVTDITIREMIKQSGAQYYMYSHDITKRPIEELLTDPRPVNDASLCSTQRQDHQDRA